MHYVGLEWLLSLPPRHYFRPLIAWNNLVELVCFNRRNDILRQYHGEAYIEKDGTTAKTARRHRCLPTLR